MTMSLALREAIHRRWTDAGLDAAVAALFPGDRDAAPETTGLPRAQYSLPADFVRAVSRATCERIQPVRFAVWGTSDSAVAAFLDAIEGAFVDAQASTVDPFALPEGDGTILGSDYREKTISQERETIFRGVLQIDVQWMKRIATST